MTETAPAVQQVKKGRRTLLLLAVVFLGPMAVAMVMYFTGFQLRPQGTTQNGELYQPPRPLPDATLALLADPAGTATLHGKWTFVYVGPGPCDPTCRQALVEIRQVRRALGRDLDRVQRAYVVTAGQADRDALAAEYPGLGLVEDAATVQGLLTVIGEARPGDVFLTDPLGNLVMRYPAGTTMKAMHADLKHLLQVSTIG
jgi:hypothetical protein